MPPRPGRRPQLSIRQKILLAVACTMLALGGIVTAITRYTTHQLERDAQGRLTVMADLEQARMREMLTAAADRLTTLTTGPVGSAAVAFTTHPSARTRRALDAALRDAPRLSGVHGVSVHAVTGARIAAGPGPLDAPTGAAARLARQAATGGAPWVAGLAFPAADGADYLQAVQIRRRGGVAAVLVGEVDLRAITRLLGADSVLGATADVRLVQPTAAGAQFITDLRHRDSGFNVTIPWARATLPAVMAATPDPPRMVRGVRDLQGRTVVSAIRRVPDTDWGLVVNVDETEAFAVARRVRVATLVAFAASMGVLMTVMLLVTRTLTRRIRRVTESAAAIEGGDLRARIGDDRGDELGILSRTFDGMAEALSRDIDRRSRVEARLAHQAEHDPLTGLPNRARAEQRLHAALAGPEPEGVAVLFCDLNAFKSVNDELGHAAGDRLLNVVAQRFRAALRPTDLLTRFGGDEFVVVCGHVTGLTEADAVADRLRAALSHPVTLGEAEARVSVSIGIALGHPGATPESILHAADAAMYLVKAAERDGRTPR